MQVNGSEARHVAQPMTVRIAMWSAHHRWLVAGLWFAITLGLFGLTFVVETKTNSLSSSSQTQTDSAKASAAFTAAGIGGHDTLTLVISNSTLKLTDPGYAVVLKDLTDKVKAVTYNDNGTQKSIFLTDALHPVQAFPSADGSSFFFRATVTGASGDAKAKIAPVKKLIADARTQHPDYQIYGESNTWLSDDFEGLLNDGLRGSLFITLPLTLAILLIAFGAVAAAFVPLVLGLTAVMASFGVVDLYSQFVSPIDSTALEVVVVIGLAVGIDYSLFLITRYRTERRRGRAKMAALEVASNTAGRAVFFSGVTVMISLAGLFFVDDTAFKSIAAGTVAAVFITVVGSLTFLPATLAILGNGINWGRIPFFGRERAEGSGFWGHLVGFVMRFPLACALISAALLLALASPALHLNLGRTTGSIDNLPSSLEGVKAIKLLQAKYPTSGSLEINAVIVGTAPLGADAQAAIARLPVEAAKVPGVSVADAKPQPFNSTLVQLTFHLADPDSNSQSNRDIVLKMRNDVVPAVFKGVPNVNVYITGATAGTVDTVMFFTGVLPVIFAFVLGFSFLLLLVVFHSIVIPIKAILLNLLSTGACYGALVLVFQDNFLADQLGLQKLGVIDAFAPVFIFTILFGLSMDYHLFILTRIKEAKDQGLSSNAAVAKGITVTSGTITSAAAIMVTVFAVMGTLQITIVKQLGLGLALAVFLDSTIIRSILLPATMRLLGDWNWYIPRFLNWLPRITLEGESEEEVVVVPAPVAEVVPSEA